MIRAFYTASSGLVAQSIRQDIIANNIANAGTPGFRRERVVASSFAQTLNDNMARLIDRERPSYPDSLVQQMTVTVDAADDMTPGPIRATGSNLDFAIDGPGVFEVTSQGRTQQTRAGNFQPNQAGELCTADGAKVMGQSGPIRLPEGKWEVAEDGSIMSDGSAVDKIKIVGGQDGQTRVLQGHLEGANFNIVREMVDMIANLRAFEANQKVVNSVDRTLDKLINEAGKV